MDEGTQGSHKISQGYCLTILVAAGSARRDCDVYEDGNADKNEKRDAAHLEVHSVYKRFYD